MSVHSLKFKMARTNNKKELIIDAAIKVFARKGFYNSKVADVAKSAGVADGTIYLYFKNKDDLLISLFETKMEEILDRFSSLIEKKISADKKLREFISLYFLMIEQDQDLAEVFQVELRQSSKFLKDYHNQKFIDFLNIIGAIIEEGIAQSLFSKSISIHNVKLLVFGALDELARQWILAGDASRNLKQTAHETAAILLHGILK